MKSISDWPTPRSARELSRFLGFVNFYRSLLPNLSNTAKPLYNLIKTPGRITLNLLENQALLQIKSLVAKHILLTFPDFNRQFFIIADASDFGLGAVLCQTPLEPIHDSSSSLPSQFYLVGVFSRVLSDAEKNYDTPDKEFLSIHSALSHWRPWLISSAFPVVIFNDHKNLEKLSESRKFSKRLFRWNNTFADFKTLFSFIPSRDTLLADILSRRPDFMPTTKNPPITILNDQNTIILNSALLRHDPSIPPNQCARTPPEFYQLLNTYCQFDHDPCPPSPSIDSLLSDWGNSNFVNPRTIISLLG